MTNENGNEKFCTRLKYVNEAIKNGKEIKIISFMHLLEILQTKEEALSQMLFPEESSFYKRRESKLKDKSVDYKKEQKIGSTTIGDFFRAQGIDLGSLINKS